MIKKEHIIIIILLIIISAFSLAIISLNCADNNEDTNDTYREVLVNDSNETSGTVEVIRNIGNPNGKRIAYVVGVHPLENETHRTLVKLLPNMTNLNYCYDIYIINVTEDIGYYGDGLNNYENPGRQNGQNLAQKYVYPEIVNGNYELAIDVHSNIGAYEYKTFVFSPVKEGKSVDYANQIAQNCENITYYAPPSTTSGPYLTIPLNENGIPAFYFEEYSFAPQDVKDEHMLELINAVDNLNF